MLRYVVRVRADARSTRWQRWAPCPAYFSDVAAVTAPQVPGRGCNLSSRVLTPGRHRPGAAALLGAQAPRARMGYDEVDLGLHAGLRLL
jgi:hypothetical protein